MKEQEGPRIGLISPRYYKTCSGCKYPEHNLWKSGLYPIYTDKCVHESAPKGGLIDFNDLDNHDGYPEPGDWCPFEPVNRVDVP